MNFDESLFEVGEEGEGEYDFEIDWDTVHYDEDRESLAVLLDGTIVLDDKFDTEMVGFEIDVGSPVFKEE